MFQSKQHYTYCIFVLKNFLMEIAGTHYPREIIWLIIMANYVRRQMSCGTNHTVMYDENKIYIWGRGSYYTLGSGNDNNMLSPTELILCENSSKLSIIQIACGASHTVALVKNNGCNEIYVWGEDAHVPKQIKIDDLEDRSNIMISCGNSHTIAFEKYNNMVYAWGNNNFGQLGLGHTDTTNSPQKMCLIGLYII